MTTHSTNSVRHLGKHRDRELVPRRLVIAMFSLMIATVALVSYAQLTDRPNTGIVPPSPVVESVEVTMTGTRTGIYTVTDANGAEIATSASDKNGFIGVIGRVFDRERMLNGVQGNPPITVVRRENGKIAIIDPATDKVVDLIGYGADNIAAFAKLLATQGN